MGIRNQQEKKRTRTITTRSESKARGQGIFNHVSDVTVLGACPNNQFVVPRRSEILRSTTPNTRIYLDTLLGIIEAYRRSKIDSMAMQGKWIV